MLAISLAGAMFYAAQGSPIVTAAMKAGQPDLEVAVTFDDLPLNGPDLPIEDLTDMTARLISVIRANRIPVVAFVNEKKLQQPGQLKQRTDLLRMWLDAGAELGNHTYSHPSLQRTDLAAYEEDVIRGEKTISLLMKERGLRLRYFRYPFLQTGPDLATRNAFESFLRGRGYTNAPVTIDNSDWEFNTVYVNALNHRDQVLARRVENAYLEYIPKITEFFERMSTDVVGRQVRHILLMHANPLSAAHLTDIIEIFRKRGYRFVTLDRALGDDAYSTAETYAGPMGVSWLERWAFTKGMKMRVAEEPDPPDFVYKLYKEYTKPAASGY